MTLYISVDKFVWVVFAPIKLKLGRVVAYGGRTEPCFRELAQLISSYKKHDLNVISHTNIFCFVYCASKNGPIIFIFRGPVEFIELFRMQKEFWKSVNLVKSYKLGKFVGI